MLVIFCTFGSQPGRLPKVATRASLEASAEINVEALQVNDIYRHRRLKYREAPPLSHSESRIASWEIQYRSEV